MKYILILILPIIFSCDSGKKAATPRFTRLKADLTTTTATFSFAYSGTMETYHIDLSTLPDMSWDVYLSFASGPSSPLQQTDPRKWDKYVPGKKLYWRK
jgi:hypothetical protein